MAKNKKARDKKINKKYLEEFTKVLDNDDLEEKIEDAEEEEALEEFAKFLKPISNTKAPVFEQREAENLERSVEFVEREEDDKKPISYTAEENSGLYFTKGEGEYLSSIGTEPEKIASSRGGFKQSYEMQEIDFAELRGGNIPQNVPRVVHRPELKRDAENPSLDRNYTHISELEERDSRHSIFRSQEKKYKIRK